METTHIHCNHPPCPNKITDHYWGKVKAEDWFLQKDGTAWCPQHIPDWVEGWRAKQNARKSV